MLPLAGTSDISGGVLRAHQRRPHQDCVRSGLDGPLDLGPGGDAALEHYGALRRDRRGEGECSVLVDLERFEIAGVHTDHLRTGGDRSLEVLLTVGLDECRELEIGRRLRERVQLRVGKARGDQEHRVGAECARLHHLGWVHEEVLAKDRDRRLHACARVTSTGPLGVSCALKRNVRPTNSEIRGQVPKPGKTKIRDLTPTRLTSWALSSRVARRAA